MSNGRNKDLARTRRATVARAAVIGIKDDHPHPVVTHPVEPVRAGTGEGMRVEALGSATWVYIINTTVDEFRGRREVADDIWGEAVYAIEPG